MSAIARALLAAILLMVGSIPNAFAAPIQIAGNPVELVVSSVGGGKTARIELVPLDSTGKALPAPSSLALVEFPATEKLRTRDMIEAQRRS